MIIHIGIEFTFNDGDAPEKQLRELCTFIQEGSAFSENIQNAFTFVAGLIGWDDQTDGVLTEEDANTILMLLDSGSDLSTFSQFILNSRALS